MAPTKSRQDLKAKFVRNAIPTEQDFKDLIDAPLNQSDDGIFRNSGEPLSIVAGSDGQKRVLRFYSEQPNSATAPEWLISLRPGQDPNNPGTNLAGFGIADGTGATKLLVNSSGNVGIGVTAPADRLDVDGRIRAGALTMGPWPANPANYAFIGSSLQNQSNAGDYALLVGTGAEVGATYLNGSASIGLRIGNAQHVTIAGNGFVGVGTSAPGYLLDVNGRMRVRQVNRQQFTAGIWFSSYSSGEADHAFVGMKSVNEVGFYGNTGTPNWRLVVNTDNGNLAVAGNAFKPGGGAWGSSSDGRLKENIRPIEGALESLLKLKGVSYEWKDPESQGGLAGPQVGFVAQDVESVFPDWVGLDSEGFKTLTIRGFEALVVEALKELKAENERLSGQLKQLQELVRLKFPELVNN